MKPESVMHRQQQQLFKVIQIGDIFVLIGMIHLLRVVIEFKVF